MCPAQTVNHVSGRSMLRARRAKLWTTKVRMMSELSGRFHLPAWRAGLPRLNRDGLTILLHPQTGDGYRDHTAHAAWLGGTLPLRLEAFNR